MMVLFVLAIILEALNAVYLYDAETDDSTPMGFLSTSDDIDFEPLVPLTKDKEKLAVIKNISCDEFSKYALNCTVDAAFMYNSSRKSPPMPAKINEWCNAIRHLTNCAIDWNTDCKDVTESHFNEESIKGHMHVLNNICDDEWFLTRYDELPTCIEHASEFWEACYTVFKLQVEEQKNTSHEWTHFETHFQLCCARARFRRCTLDHLFQIQNKCAHEQAVTLQKFSVIVSEGDVYQDCETNMMYSNCPGGDPRPSGKMLASLFDAHSYDAAIAANNVIIPNILIIFFVFLKEFSMPLKGRKAELKLGFFCAVAIVNSTVIWWLHIPGLSRQYQRVDLAVTCMVIGLVGLCFVRHL